jgi:hypothetical protein
MKNTILLFVFTIIGSTSQAQIADDLTFEAAYGMSVPLNFVSKFSNENFNSTSHFEGGIRYMFSSDFGVKGVLAYDAFSGTDTNYGIKSIMADAQLYFNLGRVVGLLYFTDETVGLYAHAGFGVTSNKSLNNGFTEHSGVCSMGLSPLFKLSDAFALSTDISYQLNIKQHMRFDGTFFEIPTVTNHNMSQFTLSIGGIYYFGGAKYHSDWAR